MFVLRFFALLAFFATSFAAENFLLEDSGDANKFTSDGIVIESGNQTVSNHGWTEYKQCDSKWGSNKLGTCSQTICSAGCAMSSVAMILKTKVNDYDRSEL